MHRGFQRIGRDEIVVLEKVAARLRREEHDDRENDQENTTPKVSFTV